MLQNIDRFELCYLLKLTLIFNYVSLLRAATRSFVNFWRSAVHYEDKKIRSVERWYLLLLLLLLLL